MTSSSRIVRLVLALSLLPATASSGCGAQFEIETPAGERLAMAAGETTRIGLRILYSVYVTIPITECFLLSCDIRILDRAWDNDVLLPLQPMNKLVWQLQREDGELVVSSDSLAYLDAGVCRLVAAGIFRATESGTYAITVTYQDETLQAPLVQELRFEAR